jgi:hypothetical protein
MVIVGDGRQIVEQVEPYTQELEFFTTAGKPKARPSLVTPPTGFPNATDLVGTWHLEISTPLGQNIPASLILTVADSKITGKVESEMGDAEINYAELSGSSFTATLAFDMGGSAMEAQIAGEVSGQEIHGNINLENTPPLPFTGAKE